MDEIARASGLSSGTLYRHFPRRDELLAEVIREDVAGVISDITDAMALPDPLLALRAALHVLAARAAANRASAEMLVRHVEQGRLDLDPEFIPALTAEGIRALDLFQAIITRAQNAGLVRTDITATDVPPILGAIGRIHVLDTDANIWERYLDLVIDGLCTPTPSRLSHQPPPHPTTAGTPLTPTAAEGPVAS
jgi:AcrR family transcriptional regulator